MSGVAFDFTGKTALVTGGTTGIGRAISLMLARSGAHVLVNSESASVCEDTVAEIKGAGGEATALAFDLSDPEQVRALASSAISVAGRIDAMFCNAGITGARRAGDADYEDEVERVFAINLHHARILCDALIPQMAIGGGGAVVITSSLSSLRGNRNIGVYSLTKAALAQLARDMAVKFGPDHVRVNAVSPGLIATGWEDKILSDPEAAAHRMRMTPLRRIGQPDEIANTALFLASDAAGFITGQNLAVDGGTSITDGN